MDRACNTVTQPGNVAGRLHSHPPGGDGLSSPGWRWLRLTLPLALPRRLPRPLSLPLQLPQPLPLALPQSLPLTLPHLLPQLLPRPLPRLLPLPLTQGSVGRSASQSKGVARYRKSSALALHRSPTFTHDTAHEPTHAQHTHTPCRCLKMSHPQAHP